MNTIDKILIGVIVFFIARFFAIKYLISAQRKRKLYNEYATILNHPEHKVKGSNWK